MLEFIKTIQIISAAILTFLVLIQSKSGGLSNTFGGSIGMYRSRRGIEKSIFILTIILGIILTVNSLVIISLSSNG